MTRTPIWLPIDAVNSFDLPEVCSLTGERGPVRWRRRMHRYAPPWAIATILIPPVALVALPALRRIVRVELPATDAALAKWRLADQLGGLSFALALLFALGAATVGLGLPIVWGFAFLGAALVVPFAGFLAYRGFRGPTLRKIRGDHVEVIVFNEDAAAAWRAHFAGVVEGAPDRFADGATGCSRDEETAVASCTRCGDFLCRGCLRTFDGSPLRYCEGCLHARAEHLDGKRLGRVDPNLPAQYGCLLSPLTWIPLVWFLAPLALGLSVWGIVRAFRVGRYALGNAIVALPIAAVGCFLLVAALTGRI